MATTTLAVAGMTCEHCRRHVEDALRGVVGVWSAQVDLGRGEAEVDHDERGAPAAALLAAVEGAGYQAAVAS